MTKNLRETPITEKIEFNAFIPLKQQAVDPSDPDKSIRLEGLARTTDISLSRHKTTEKCIKSLKNQAVGSVALLDHDSSKVIGTIIGVKPSPDSEFWPIEELLPLTGNDVVDAPVLQVQHWLKNKVPIGMSIHGWITEGKFVEDLDNDEWWIEIDDMILFENSITTLPAQLETTGRTLLTNSCPHGVCAQAAIQIKEHLVKSNPTINEAIKEHELRKAGKKPKSEVNQMAEEKIEVDKVKFEKMEQTLGVLLQGETRRQEEAREAAEKQRMEDLKQSIKTELETELVTKVTEAATAAAKEIIQETIGTLIQDRTHTRPSLQTPPQMNPGEIQQIAGELVPRVTIPVKQKLNDPANYPAVMGGEVVQGVTSGQLLGVEQ